MHKKLKLESNNPKTFYYNQEQSKKKSEEDLWKALVIEHIEKESYLGAFLMLQERLREQAKNNQLVEDKRTEGIN